MDVRHRPPGVADDSTHRPYESSPSVEEKDIPMKDAGVVEKPQLLKRRLGMGDIGRFMRILSKAREEGRTKVLARGFPEDQQIDMFMMFAESWDVIEDELAAWIRDLTGCSDSEARDLEYFSMVLEEMEEGGGLRRFLGAITRLQNLGSAGTSAGDS